MPKEPSVDAVPISTEFLSAHVESLRVAMETMDVNDKLAKVKAEIEVSKQHWSELASTYYTCAEGPMADSSSTSLPQWIHEEGTPEWKVEVAEDNVRLFRSLQAKYPGGFFFDECDLGPDSTQQVPSWMLGGFDEIFPSGEVTLSSATPFAEGVQGELFHAHRITYDGKREEHYVMKVFKYATPLRDLIRLFPTNMLADDGTRIHGAFALDTEYCNKIVGARLLKPTGRFALLMPRAWGDLRKLINERMLHFNCEGPPFPNAVAFSFIHEIAYGMMELHERDVIHRDLKAANVLVFGSNDADKFVTSTLDRSYWEQLSLECCVADYECSGGVVRTGFWRAPEILQALKNQSIHEKPEVFTKQADVYSFGMTSYEVLFGRLPLEELQGYGYDGVLGGARPMLPRRTPRWMKKLMTSCWEKDPLKRPPFQEIVRTLELYHEI